MPTARSLRSSKKNPAGGPAGLKEHHSNSGITSSADALNAVLGDRCRLHMSNLAGELSRGSSLDVCRSHKSHTTSLNLVVSSSKKPFPSCPSTYMIRGKVIPPPAFSLHGWLCVGRDAQVRTNGISVTSWLTNCCATRPPEPPLPCSRGILEQA
jgi:hypothetical protein